MSNIITTVGHDIKVAALDTAHAAEAIVGALPRAAAVLADALKDEPQIKAAVLALIEQGAKVGADTAVAVADKGTNLVADAADVADAQAFINYFRSVFVPEVAAFYSQVRADIEASA